MVIRFESDGSLQLDGFAADVTCAPPDYGPAGPCVAAYDLIAASERTCNNQFRGDTNETPCKYQRMMELSKGAEQAGEVALLLAVLLPFLASFVSGLTEANAMSQPVRCWRSDRASAGCRCMDTCCAVLARAVLGFVVFVFLAVIFFVGKDAVEEIVCDAGCWTRCRTEEGDTSSFRHFCPPNQSD